MHETYWYVLFVRTGSEEKLVKILNEKLARDTFKPFVLKGTHIRRRQGECTKFESLCFPGYVFVETEMASAEFREYANAVILPLDNIFRLLDYGDKSDIGIAVREEERLFLNAVFGDEYCLDVPRILKEGDSVKVVSGPLAGHESYIVRLNKNGVVIAVELLGNSVEVHLGVEFVRVVEV